MRRELLGTLALLVLGVGFAGAQKPEQLPAPEAAPKADAKPESKGSGPAVQSTVASKDEGLVDGTPLWAGCEEECKPDKKCCNTPGCAWISAEYLHWWLKDAPLPDGIGTLNYGPTAGLRWSAGLHNDKGTLGLEGGMFFLERRAASLSADASSILGPGSAAFLSAGNRFWGGEALLTKAAFGQYGKKASYQFDLLGGFQYLDLGENLDAVATAADVAVDADFRTRNQFFGGQLGLRGEFRAGRWFLFGSGRCGLGLAHQQASVVASATAGGITTSAAAHHVHDEFAVVPQVTLNLGYQVTRHLRVYAGYDYLYWSTVARPGDNVLLAVPGVRVDQTNFYTHGVNFGAGWHF